MKKCPSCGRTYVDPALNFCLQDGTVLEQDTVSTFGNEETMIAGQPLNTNPNRSPYSNPTNPPPTWAAQPYGAQPRKRKSRAWLWVLLTFLVFGMIAVSGFFGFLVYLGMKMEEAKNKNKSAVNSYGTNKVKLNVNSNTKTGDGEGEVKKEDFSKWKTGVFDYGTVEYKDNELIVTSKDKDHYCLIHALPNFLSNDAVTRVTVKNVSSRAADSGFGLMVNGNPLVVMLKDYAFLIRTDGKPSYRIVQHSVSTQKELVKWTPSSAINDGDDENDLEVRDEGKKLLFYINGTLVATIDDKNGEANSVAGIYSGDGIPIAFSALEIEKTK